MAFDESFRPWHMMEAINNICDEHLALAEMQLELRKTYLNSLKDGIFTSLDDLIYMLQQYACFMREIVAMIVLKSFDQQISCSLTVSSITSIQKCSADGLNYYYR